MKVIDPGHEYELDSLDGEQVNHLVFVKRQGPGYPGNVGAHPGTTLQEVLRALLDRVGYVHDQIPDEDTRAAYRCLAHALWHLERRAARRHGRDAPALEDAVNGTGKCKLCGHVGCPGDCRTHNGRKHE